MELNEALSQIAEIRGAIARAQTFRGFRSLTTAASGFVAFGCAAWQSAWVADPSHELRRWMYVWWVAAVVSIVLIAAEMVYRCRWSAVKREATLAVAGQFMPSLAAGLLITIVMVRYNWNLQWLLPGLWAVLLAMGVFAARPHLLRGVHVVAGYYLIAGLFNLTLTPAQALSPWTMGITFGVGQFLAAAVLYWSIERREPADDDDADDEGADLSTTD